MIDIKINIGKKEIVLDLTDALGDTILQKIGKPDKRKGLNELEKYEYIAEQIKILIVNLANQSEEVAKLEEADTDKLKVETTFKKNP
jgi:hypothetical protein